MKAGPTETETSARSGGCLQVTGGAVDVGSRKLSEAKFDGEGR
jgi:hypothetical protein